MNIAYNKKGTAVTVKISKLLRLSLQEVDSMESVLGTIVVVGILICVIGLAIFSMIRDKRNGKSLQCGCDCKKCGGHCHNGQKR